MFRTLTMDFRSVTLLKFLKTGPFKDPRVCLLKVRWGICWVAPIPQGYLRPDQILRTTHSAGVVLLRLPFGKIIEGGLGGHERSARSPKL